MTQQKQYWKDFTSKSTDFTKNDMSVFKIVFELL